MSTGSSIHHTQELLKEHEDFQITAKVCECMCVSVCVCVVKLACGPLTVSAVLLPVDLSACLHSAPLWGPFPRQRIVLTPLCCVTVIVLENKLLCPSSNTLLRNSLSLSLCLSRIHLFLRRQIHSVSNSLRPLTWLRFVFSIDSKPKRGWSCWSSWPMGFVTRATPMPWR